MNNGRRIQKITHETFNEKIKNKPKAIVLLQYLFPENNFPTEVEKYFINEYKDEMFLGYTSEMNASWVDKKFKINDMEKIQEGYYLFVHGQVKAFLSQDKINNNESEQLIGVGLFLIAAMIDKKKSEYYASSIKNLNSKKIIALLENEIKKIEKNDNKTTNGKKETYIEPLLNPYEILEVEKVASRDEIEQARREKLKLYHPDKVSQLGEKLKQVAEEETKKINEAFLKIKNEKGF